MKFVILALSLGVVLAQQAGVIVPPRNWQYTVGDRSCTRAHCSVRYPVTKDDCPCGGHKIVKAQIMSCLPHCGADCNMCKQVYPMEKHENCPRRFCAPGEYEKLNIDCQVSDWPTEWSECTKPCKDKNGAGVQFKRRSILKASQGSGAKCPDPEDLYMEQTCNDVKCTDPLACHENPYCAGAMEECPNVKCDVKQHELDGGAPELGKLPPLATNCKDDGYGIVTCDQKDFFAHTDGKYYQAYGHHHIRVSHKSWSPRTVPEAGRQNDGDKHFCRIHYPFGLKKPYCKCLCAKKEAVVTQCNFDRTECHLVATKGLLAATKAATTSTTKHFTDGNHLEAGAPKAADGSSISEVTISKLGKDASRGNVLIQRLGSKGFLANPCTTDACKRANANVICRENGYMWGRSDASIAAPSTATKKVTDNRACTGTESTYQACPESATGGTGVFAISCFNVPIDVADFVKLGVYERCNLHSWHSLGTDTQLSDVERRVSPSLPVQAQVVGKCPAFPPALNSVSIVSKGKHLMRTGMVYILTNSGSKNVCMDSSDMAGARRIATAVCHERGFYAGKPHAGNAVSSGTVRKCSGSEQHYSHCEVTSTACTNDLSVQCFMEDDLPKLSDARTDADWSAYYTTGSWAASS